MFRWLMPYERPSLQGASPQLALYLNAGQLVHATGNAYPVPMIGSCCVPILWDIAFFWSSRSFSTKSGMNPLVPSQSGY